MKRLAAIALALAMMPEAQAAQLTVLSMHYASDHFVPQLRLDGRIEAGDSAVIADLLDNLVGCTATCGGASAVLTLDSFGGDFIEAKKIAELLAARGVATVIEADAACYSACLVAFAGGTALDQGVASADRIVVPGARLALYPLERPHDGLSWAVLTYGLENVLGGTTDELLQLAEAGELGLDPMIVEELFQPITFEPRDLTTPSKLRLLDARLPPAPPEAVMPDRISGLMNACAWALTNFNAEQDGGAVHLVPEDALLQVDLTFQPDIGGLWEGFRVNDSVVSLCVTDPDRGEPTLWLMGPGEAETTELFAMTIEPHLLLPISRPIVEVENRYRPYVDAWTFRGATLARLPEVLPGITPLFSGLQQRISSLGDALVFEQAGTAQLFDALESYIEGPAIIDQDNSAQGDGLVVRGDYADSGNGLVIVARRNGPDAVLSQIDLGKPWAALSEEERDAVTSWTCSVVAGEPDASC